MTHPPFDRRWLLQSAAAASLAALGMPAVCAAAPEATLANVKTALRGEKTPSSAITVDVPDIADDGAVVPVSVMSALAGTRELLIFVDVNPQPLALQFTVPEGTEPYVATRIRMAGSGTLYAAVRTGDGSLHAVAKRVQVTVGGCG